ncbi:MAG TPA: heavy metal translocating P-type ATPase [Gemmatimonadales bacterium]|nr:heavy metal translocating P-type ATPase [Gemmatimonadales bacterium]
MANKAVGALARRPVPLIAAVGLAAGLLARSDTVFLVALVIGGVPLVFKTARGMLRGQFAADIVASLAIVTALLLGQYFAGVVIVLMQSGGEALEAYAMQRASSSLEGLLARAPKIAHRIRGNEIADVPVDAVRVGDELIVRPGDLIPVDVDVLDGTSTVDQSALTGEPVPVRAVAGTHLLSGSVNLDGALRVRALRPSAQSQYQQIVLLVERARREKPPIQRIADRFAVWFTPITLVMCGVAYLVTGSPSSMLAVLVVATPCPLILATPVAVIAGISRAADIGVIVKHGRAIEQLGRARAVVFDKTGTLTLGRPSVAETEALDGVAAGEVLRLAAAVEQLSSHHLGHAMVDAARERFGTLPAVTDFRESPGNGVSGTVEGQAVVVGSIRHLRNAGVAIPETANDGTEAHIALDGRLVGTIGFADRLRHQVPALMQRLAVLGVSDTVMLTGDREAPAEAIATQAGIRTVRANLLPADKVEAVRDLARRYGNVLMVGDGINDAPALAAATVGVAMGAHGTAISAEAADVVLLVDDIARLGDAMVISRRMRRIALQSIGVGLGVSFALMVIASLGHITPAAGAVMQEALDAAVILNALRVR